MFFPRVSLPAGALALALAAALPAAAQTTDAMTGDWGGTRTALEDDGIKLGFGYTSEDAYNTSGGDRSDFAHSGQLTLDSTFDLGKLWGWDGTQFRFTLTHRDGDNLNDKVGLNELLQSQEVFGRGRIWRISNLWLSHDFADGRVQVKAGRLAVGDDFDNLNCEFMSLTFCGSQTAMIVGDYWYNGPISQWGALVNAWLTPQIYLRAGAYQVNPTYARESHGLALNPSGTIGTLTPVELGWNPQLGDKLDGHYALGGWYSSAPREDVYRDINNDPAGLTGLDLAMRTGAYGGYFVGAQQFTHGNGGSDKAGLRGFFNVVQTDRRTGSIDRTANLGVTYTGIGQARAQDQIGLALGATHVNGRLGDYQRQVNTLGGVPVTVQGGSEYSAELYYAFAATGWLILRPDLQYVVHPGGSSDNPDVMVVGVKTSIAF
jgi:porin